MKLIAPAVPLRVLVLHASGVGSTAELARFVGEVLRERGHEVDVHAVADMTDAALQLPTYDRIVLGSAIRYDRWLPEMRRFVEAHGELLATRPVSAFFTCLALSRPTGEAQAAGYAERVRALFAPATELEVQGFAGVLDLKKLPFVQRWLLGAIAAFNGVPEGDYRDWGAVRAWAEALAPASSGASLPRPAPQAG